MDRGGEHAAPGGGLAPFVWLWAGQTLSLIGSGLTGFAVSVWVFSRTGSVTDFSLFAFCNYLPPVLLAPLAGVLVDRWEPRRAMFVADAIGAASTLVILASYASGAQHLWQVLLATAVSSSSRAFQWPAYSASVTRLVPPDHYGRANGLKELGPAAEYVLAPLVAAALLEVVSLAGIIAIDLATFVGSTIVLGVLRFPKRRAEPAIERSLWREMRAGWSFIRERPGLFGLSVFWALAYFAGGFVMALVTPLVLSFADEATLGPVLAVCGLGMIAGAVTMSAMGGFRRLVVAILIAEVANGLFMIIGGLRPSAWLVGACGFGWFFTVAVLSSNDQTIWQRKVPEALQGRVFSTTRMIKWSMAPLAYLLAGPLADRWVGPLLLEGGALEGSVGSVIGVGPGRGIALVLMLGGVFKVALAGATSLYRPIRELERDLPDVTVAVNEPTPEALAG